MGRPGSGRYFLELTVHQQPLGRAPAVQPGRGDGAGARARPLQVPARPTHLAESECPMSAEHDRLEEARQRQTPWKKWGPYLSERQWGTVREDYSEGGDAWNYFSHDQARSRAYRWGE